MQTKLYIPSPRPTLTPRPHLIEKLNQGLSNKLALVSAPAGFGKTTLLSEWVQQCERPVSWTSLDEGDNDPARFLAYLVAALQKIAPDIGESTLAQRPSPEMLATEIALTAVINDITANPENFILVLDDYHLITAQPVHDALTFLLDHQPPQVHLVIATRADPPLPLALLRGRGQLTELRQADLRFTPNEAATFLNQVMGLKLSADDVVVLSARTEGWITGLQMAAVSMQGREDTATFIRAFAGSDRYVADYLVEEVLNRQPDHIQDFLLKTAVLDRLSAPLCDAVLEIDDWRVETDSSTNLHPPVPSLQILEQLERANLFIVPLDEGREWYRYHRLFTDLLRRRLHQSQPTLIPELHRRASDWYEQTGLAALAIDHALSAVDFMRAARLIEQSAEVTIWRSEMVTFLGWMESLPGELIQARPTLCLYHAWALLQSGRSLDVVESHLQRLVDANLMSGEVMVLQSLLAVYQGQIPLAIELARKALAQLPPDEPFLRHAAIWNLGFSHLVDGDTKASIQALAEAARTSQTAGNTIVAVSALCQTARLSRRQGELQKAQAIYQEALALAVDEEKRPLPIAGLALIGLGELARERNELEITADYLNDGIQLALQWRTIDALTGYTSLARLRQAQGDEDGANEAMQQARQLALQSDATDFDDRVAAFFQAQIWVAQGNIAAALRWAEEKGLDRDFDLAQLEKMDDFVTAHLGKYEYLVLARILIAQNQPGEALSILRPLLAWMERRERKDLQIEIQILIALACQEQGEVTQALVALESALSLAEPGGHARIFVDEGQPMIRLLQQALQQGIMPSYICKLLSECGPVLSGAEGMRNADSGIPHSTLPTLHSAMVDPLSQRELEILQLIAEGLSNREIGQRLVLSLPTVKWHASNIYGKLGVRNRGTAVARARELHLLP